MSSSLDMNCKCHGSGCEKLIFDNYYCDSCFNELQKQKQHSSVPSTEQKEKQKPKVNEAKLIHKAMFG